MFASEHLGSRGCTGGEAMNIRSIWSCTLVSYQSGSTFSRTASYSNSTFLNERANQMRDLLCFYPTWTFYLEANSEGSAGYLSC